MIHASHLFMHCLSWILDVIPTNSMEFMTRFKVSDKLLSLLVLAPANAN